MANSGRNIARQLIASHLAGGEMRPGSEIALTVDQTLTQDATGTLVMLELEALGLDRVRTEVSVQYVDHNLLQADSKHQDDHLFLRSACRRFGLWYSKPGNGVSHPVHMQRFGIPGKVLAGSDSHTCAAGSLGMLAIGTGGLDVAMAMAGEPLYLRMPEIWGIELTGTLPAWVSAKDVVLEMLRRHGVKGGVNRIIEYHGDGLAGLTAMDRHVIANMGAELGATTTVFPSDGAVLEFLRAQGREQDYTELRAEPGAGYDVIDSIDLSRLEPLIAAPSSPGNVVPVREAAGEPVFQVVIGSSANPGLRDFAIAAEIVKGGQAHDQVSFDINPSSRQTLADLAGQRVAVGPDRGRRPDPPVRLPGLHRHGPSAGHRPQQPAHRSPQLPRPVGHGGGLGVALLTGDRRGRRADRRDHRPPGPGRPLPETRTAHADAGQHRDARRPAPGRRRS
jgi:aconitate hydratase